MKRIEFHPDAEEELLGAQQWYRERSDVVAQAFALEIDAAIASIAEVPERWPATSSGASSCSSKVPVYDPLSCAVGRDLHHRRGSSETSAALLASP
jgi:hypothetical protein